MKSLIHSGFDESLITGFEDNITKAFDRGLV
jgi:hypothetical protein